MMADFGGMAPASALAANEGAIVLRTAIPLRTLESQIRATVRSIDPQLALDQMQTMEEVLASSEAPRRFNTVLISSFAAMAMLLAALGIYSVTAFTVALRMREFAIRMALGSQRTGIFRLIILSVLRLAAVGIGAGLVGVYGMASVLKSFLFEVQELDPETLFGSVAFLVLLAVFACLWPARKAATTDSLRALRAE